MNYTISIVVAVYNAEKYLHKCIGSVLKQTYKEFELVLVNDGSTDTSKRIIEEYIENYPDKIKLFNKENGGLSSARNTGLAHVSGKYVCFLDADDYFEEHYLENLVSVAEEYQCDMVCSGQYKVDERGKILNTIYFDAKEGRCLSRRLNISGKLYKMEYIRKWNLEFPLGKKYEDNSFNLQALFLSNQIYFLTYVGYYQLIHEGSITSEPIEYGELPFDEWEYCIKKVLDNYNINGVDKELFEFTTISFFVYFLLIRNRKREYLDNDKKRNNLESVLKIAEHFQKIINTYFTDARNNKYANIFHYKELSFFHRLGVKIFSWICYLKKAKQFTKFFYIVMGR